jgi:hypothetical protein
MLRVGCVDAACTRYASNVGRADDVVRGNNCTSRYNLEALVSSM